MIRKKEKTKRKHNHLLLSAALLCVCSFIVWGNACSKQPEPAKPAALKPSDAKPPAVKDKVATQKPEASPKKTPQTGIQEYSYNASGKPDPFEPLVTDMIFTKKSPPEGSKDSPELPPLQKYDLSEFKLVAIILGDNNARVGMVEDKAGYGYILRKGMLVGKHDGIIQDITENSVLVTEKITDAEGKEATKTTTLNIYKSESGEK